jgi:hypothetical protein
MPARQRLILILLIPLTALIVVLLGALSVQPTATDHTDLQLTAGVYLPAATADWLALIAFAPLFIALAFAWQTEKPITAYFQPELVGTFAWWISFANGYAVLYALRLGLLPNYETELLQLNDQRLLVLPINFWIIGLTAATIVFFIWFLFFRRYGFGAMADRIHLPHRRVALLGLLAGLAVAVWVLGGLNFSLYLILPVWLWIFIEPTSNPRTKAVNAVLALGGGAVLLSPSLFLPADVGLWQIIAGTAYLTLLPIDVLFYFLALALCLRFLRLGFSKPYVAPVIPEDPLMALLKTQ